MTIYGVDVSTFQAPTAIPRDVDFVLARSNFGATPDRRAPEHAAAVRLRGDGTAFGLYAFFVPTVAVQAQVDAFRRSADACQLGAGDVIPWVDVESYKADGSAPPAPEWCGPLEEFCGRLDVDFGVAGTYISQRDFKRLGIPAWLLARPLWVPHWRQTPGAPAVPTAARAIARSLYSVPVIWQYRVGPYRRGALHVAGEQLAPNAIDHDRCDDYLPRIGSAVVKTSPEPCRKPVAPSGFDPSLDLTEDDWLRMRSERDALIEAEEP